MLVKSLFDQYFTIFHRPGKLDRLSQHAVDQSQAKEARQAIPACMR